MSEWREMRIGEYADTFAGGTPDRGDDSLFGGTIPWIKSTEVNLGRIKETEEFLSEKGLRTSAAKWIPANAVLVAMYGATAAQVAYLEIEATANQAVLAICPREQLDPLYLFYSLTSAKHRLLYLAQGSGQPNLNKQIVDRFAFPAPPLPQQRRIAIILTTLDEVIAATEKLVEKHQQIKAGLMHDLFTRGLWTRPELARGDHKGLPCESTAQEGQLRPTPEQAPGLYQDSPLGLIPKGWQIVTTLDCASESPGSTTIGPFGSDLVSADYQSEGIPVVFVRDVKSTGFEWNSEVYVSPEKAFRLSAHAVRPGDILSSKMGLPPCISCTYPDWMPDGIITADMIRLRPDLSMVTSQWLTAALNGDAFKRQVQTITAGVTRPKVTLSDFRKLRVARPLLEEQKLIDALLTRHENVLSANHQYLAKLRQQKQGLMHDLLTGRVRVADY